MHTLAPSDLRRPQRLLRTRAPWTAIVYLVCEALGGLIAMGSWFTVVLIPVWLLVWPRLEERLVSLAGHRRPVVTRRRWEMRWQDVVLVLLTAPMAVLVGFSGFLLLIVLGMLLGAPFVAATGRQLTGFDPDHVLPTVPTAIIAPLLGLLLVFLLLWGVTALAYGWGWLSVRLLRDDAKRLAAQVEALGAQAVRSGDAIALERRALERDLHDGAQMHLSAAGMRLAMLQLDAESLPEQPGDTRREDLLDGLDAVRQQLDLAARSVRSAARGLVPSALRDGGLDQALAELVRSLPIDVDLVCRGPRLSENLEQSLYLVASEALTNVVRHADARRAEVTCTLEDGTVVLQVSDDGRGGAEETGTGLVSMRARARALGGSFELSSPVGGPTVLRVRVPAHVREPDTADGDDGEESTR